MSCTTSFYKAGDQVWKVLFFREHPDTPNFNVPNKEIDDVPLSKLILGSQNGRTAHCCFE